MKKRILSILLTLCMTLCLTPISVFAEKVGAWGSAAIQLGADALNKTVNTEIAPTVYFGQNHENNPAAWRVIGYDGNGVTSAQGDITLLAAYNMGWSKFGSSAAYADSDLKTAIDALAEKLTSKETDAVQKQTLASGSYNRENTDCVSGTQVNNAVFWPLSTAEASAVNNDLRIADREHQYWASSYWWLRSPGAKGRDVASVDGFANIDHDGIDISNIWGVRPAFKLNLNSVLFASAAVGGKPDGGLTAVPEYSGNEWKLTLLDNSNNFAVTEKAISAAPGDTVVMNYTGASAWLNEYISAIIADSSGAQYYGRITRPDMGNGTVEIKIPSDLAPGSYTLKVFSEQYNGDYNTDYASNFTDIALTVENQPDEQFTLAPGGRYYFDLSAMKIPGKANGDLPDSTLHYVPFTYVGTVDAYKLTSETATTNEYAQQNKYAHSLFVADYAVTHKVNWNNLDTASLIFGKDYVAGGVDYTLRAPSVGSNYTGSGNSERGVPQSNEWDTMLNKDSGYIQNWNGMYSWGQDAFSGGASYRAIRGYNSARIWVSINAAYSSPDVGFRPVLEVLNSDTLDSDGMKAVTLDLNGGKLGGSSEDIQIIVKNGSTFTAPASGGLTRPDGDTGSYFMWLGSDGKLYAPGAIVPADVTKLTAQFALSEQFSLKPGGTYYFDLSAMGIPGTVNDALPDSTLHYVPFTYVGTVDAYKLTSAMATTEEYAQQNKYAHSLFIADYNVTHTVSWNDLDTASLIFGKDYVAGSVDYTLRAPSVGSSYTGSGDSERGTPKSNEWDKILDKDDGYIKNWGKMLSCGQDTTIRISASFRAVRGWKRSARFWTSYNTSYQTFGFRPVLEVPNPGTLGADGLKAVTLNLGGGKLGGSSDAIHIIVKNGSAFTAPASDGMTRPAGDTGSYFMWLDGNGKSYEPGDSVPADVTELTVQWTAPTYTVTLHANGGTINNGNVTEYTYGVGATLPTDVTRTGYTFKGWYYNENLTGSPVTAIGDTETGNKEYWAKWEINQYTVTVKPENGEADITITQDYGTPITAPADPTREGYTFIGWDREIPTTMPAEDMTVTAQWEINQYTITFDTNGGSEIAPITQDYGTNITAPADPIREGYTFIGWDREISKTMPAENMTVTARWEINRYTITFDPAGGSEIAPITQDYGTNITAPADPTREGYTFIGWDREIPTTMPAEDMTVTAQWEINQYTITFDTNGGSEIAPITQDYGTNITAPADPIREGYTFIGWDREISKTMPAENMTVTARWEINRYTITFDPAGGSEIAPITQDYGTNITAPADPTREGYTFIGWDRDIPVTMPAENITVTAQWEINRYTITFDTAGGSEIAPITQDYGTNITAPANPTRKGYTFKGWDKEIPETMPAENITVKAQWEINQYTIAFDTNGGSEIAPITQDYSTEITAPDNPTRKGYTFKGWDKEIPETMPAENMTITAQWEINRYTITFDTAGGSEIAPITQDYGTNITAPADPTREGYTFIGWDKAIPTTMPAENITVTAQWKDSEKPTGEIKINENSWKAFLNNITFGLFFKDTQTVTINAADNSGETVTVEYLLSDKELTKTELDGMTFTVYTAQFGIDPDNEYIIYVRLTDNAGNTDYICSDGIVLDGTSPVITGIEDGKTYCAAQTVTITEKYVDTVTVNGTAVTLDENNSFTLAPSDGEQKIVVTDKAGNTAEMTVTVNDGHTFGEWTSNGDGTHTRQCTADGCTEGIETDNCTDEDKNHICDICGNIISNHEDANQDHVCDLCGKVISNHEDADKDHVCDHCGKVISNHEDANKDHVCDYCGKTISNHEDADKDHICDLCGKTISNHEDADNNHICDYCGKTISNHEDADKDHICDHCGKVISNHEDANKDHVCDYCGKTISNHEDADKDHICDLCGKTISNHEDADNDHVCDYCGKVITNHIGGKETCRDKAVCEVCGKSYGKLDPNNHTDLKHFPAKAATEDADGNIEYWYCSGCNKYYSDKDGTKEIAKADTVTAKLPKSPPTGDNSNLMLWIALLFISGGVLTGVTVFDKRKRHSVK